MRMAEDVRRLVFADTCGLNCLAVEVKLSVGLKGCSGLVVTLEA